MVTIAVGALLGWAFSGALIGWGLVTTAFGAIMLGASLGSLFMPRDMGDFSSSPTYSFGPISNTMSQLVPIPVIYGKCRVAGNIIYQAFADDKKEVQDLYILVGEGPVTEINSVLCNDQDPAALEDCSLTTYLNTAAATHDSRDPSGARPYPDDVALICLTLKAQEKLNGTPTVTSIINGVKVWTPAGFAWSRNPVWIILDILCHPRYGLGYGAIANGVYQHPDWDKIDYACAVAAATYCDGTVSYGTRFQLDFALDTQRPIRDVLADFLASCRGYMIETDKLQICIDAPVSIYSREITPNNIVEGSFTFWQASDQDVCNRITVDWIDPDNSYERVTDVFQDSTDIADRGVVEKSISLLPVTRSGQVGHMGYYLLKTSLLVRNFCSFGVGLKDCDIMPGEVLLITFVSFTGWNQKPFRVVSVKDSGQDVMTVTCSEYIADVYDDSVLDITHHIDTSLTTNYKPDDVTEMAITEQLVTLQDGSYNLIAKISWTPPASYASLELWYRYSSEVSWKPAGTLPRGSEEYYLPCTEKIGDTLYVKIYVVSRLGVRSDGQTTSKILRGDLTPPAPPTNLKGTGGFRMASLTWADPGDGDLDHIEIYRSLESDAAEMTKIGIAPRFAQEYVDSNLYVLQTAWYRLKAVDVAGNKSECSAVISVTAEELRAADIPDQSIRPSKFLPKLQSMLEEIKAISASSIINSVNEDENRDTAAKATQELDTKVVEGLEAEALARTQLAATVGENASAIVAEQKARAEADSAEATAREALAVKVGQDISAAVQTEAQARASADQAEALARTQLAAKVGENTAAIQTNASAIATVDGKVEATYSIGVDANGRIAGFKLGSDGEISEMVFLANAFYFANPVDGGDPIPLFTIDATGETPKLVMNGNLFVNAAKGADGGWIVGNMISAAAQIQIGAGGSLIMGNGSLFQMGSGAVIIDSDAGVLQIKDPNNLATGDYIRMETGDLTSYKYIMDAYRPMKSLRKMEVGVAQNNGERIILPGFWPSQPKIMVSPNALQSYNASAPTQSQQLRVYADEITYYTSTGKAHFIPRAYLEIAAGGNLLQRPVPLKNIVLGKYTASQSYVTLPATINTDAYASVPSGAKNIVVTAKCYAQYCDGYSQSSGNFNYYYNPVKVTLTAYVGGSSVALGSYTFPSRADYISSEPDSQYVTFSGTLPAGAGNVYVSAYVERLTGNVGFGDLENLYRSRCWLRLESIQWSLAGSTQLAAGTLNWVAIAE